MIFRSRMSSASTRRASRMTRQMMMTCGPREGAETVRPKQAPPSVSQGWVGNTWVKPLGKGAKDGSPLPAAPAPQGSPLGAIVSQKPPLPAAFRACWPPGGACPPRAALYSPLTDPRSPLVFFFLTCSLFPSISQTKLLIPRWQKIIKKILRAFIF